MCHVILTVRDQVFLTTKECLFLKQEYILIFRMTRMKYIYAGYLSLLGKIFKCCQNYRKKYCPHAPEVI